MQIVTVPIWDLNPAEYNPRKWSAKATADLIESIKRFGLIDPIIANGAENRKNIVIGGHFRLHCAKELGYTEVPVVYLDVPDIEREKELNLRLNKNLGDWDFDLLATFDESMLFDSGFSSDELDRIFNNDEDDEFDADAEAEKITEPVSKRGDVYLLGHHRLMCGDSTSAADVAKLMDGKKANMVFTDPPYNVAYAGTVSKRWEVIENDAMDQASFVQFLTAAFERMMEATTDTAAVYVCYASRNHKDFEDALVLTGFTIKSQIIWVKTLAQYHWSDYRWKHEPLLYCGKKNGSVEFYGDRKQYTEWREELSDTQLLERVKKLIEKDETGGSTVWRLKRDMKYDHPTQKPLQLVKIALQNSSRRNENVLDLFGGGGSTLIACEQNGRTSFTMEIDAKYCDVIVKRWEKETGQSAQRI